MSSGIAMFDTLSRQTLQSKLSWRSAVPSHPCPALSWGAMTQDDSEWNFVHLTGRRQGTASERDGEPVRPTAELQVAPPLAAWREPELSLLRIPLHRLPRVRAG